MGLFSKLFNKAPSVDVLKADGISWIDQMHFFRDGGTGAAKMSRAEQLATIKTNALVFACVTTKARAFQQAPLVLEVLDPKADTWSSRTDSEFLECFQNNPELSESEIKQYISMHLDLCGQSFLWEWKSGDGMTREVWPIPPSWVEVKTVDRNMGAEAGKRVIEAFIVSPPDQLGVQYPVAVDDMVYIRIPDPCNLRDGLSPVAAGGANIDLDNKSSEYKKDAIVALNLPGVAVKTRKPLNQRQKDDLRALLQQKLGGNARQNAVLISGDDAEIQLLNPMKDFEWTSYGNINETRICMVFGVPPIVVGALVGLENSPWSNTGEAKRWLYQNTIAGMWSMVATSLTRALIPANMRDRMRIAFDLSEIKELRDDLDAVVKRAGEMFNAGIITRNEAREMIDYEASKSGELYKYQMATILVDDEGSDALAPVDETLSEEEQAEGVAMGNQ